MTSYVNGEIMIFLWSILCGAVIMVLHDIFCIFTDDENYSILVYNIFDTIFIICACAIMIFIMLNISDGYIRFYEFVGAFIGAFLYKCTLSQLLKFLFSKIICSIFSIFQLFLKILLTPLKFMYKIICDCINMLCFAVKKCSTPLLTRSLRNLSIIKILLKKT